MKFKLICIFFLGSLFYLTSCKNVKAEKDGFTEINKYEESPVKMPEPDIGVILIDNKRWEANPETTAGINAMQRHIMEFTKKPDSHGQLKHRLEIEFSLLVQECTMKGEAHEQLHTFLVPIVASFDALDLEDMDTATSALNGLEQHLALYSVYFE